MAQILGSTPATSGERNDHAGDGIRETYPPLGGRLVMDGAVFGLFTEPESRCAVRIFSEGTAVDHPLQGRGDGFFEAHVPALTHGALYKFVVNDRDLPDPFARFLPQGVHGPAMLVQDRYTWRCGAGISRPLDQHVIYELHVGTFTPEGTYQGVRRRLRELSDLGVTALELMPLAAFPGARGWGYEGVSLFAPFAPYGEPDDLRRLVDEAHGHGLSVFLDVVYNHFGPAGNYLPAYSAAYFSADQHNAWGQAPNYAHPVLRRAILENAVYWLKEFRFDGLRLDATHAIVDPSSPDILRLLCQTTAELTPSKLLIAEDNRNDCALVKSEGMHGVWADDFHHQLRVTMTGERDGYYAAYQPGLEALARTINQGWLYQGELFGPTGEKRGCPAGDLDAAAFVYCIQNHDQIGNRAFGDRLSAAVSLQQYRAASTLLLFLPMTPLLFMGQEWAASSPFQFFTDHAPELGRLISQGRRDEFSGFQAFQTAEGRNSIPDPQVEDTFRRSKLLWEERERDEHKGVLSLYTRLLSLRRTDPVLRANAGGRRGLSAWASGKTLMVRRESPAGARQLAVNFGSAAAPLDGGLASAKLILRSDGVSSTERFDDLPAFTAMIFAGIDGGAT